MALFNCLDLDLTVRCFGCGLVFVVGCFLGVWIGFTCLFVVDDFYLFVMVCVVVKLRVIDLIVVVCLVCYMMVICYV